MITQAGSSNAGARLVLLTPNQLNSKVCKGVPWEFSLIFQLQLTYNIVSFMHMTVIRHLYTL